jgi:hypothetical protein
MDSVFVLYACLRVPCGGVDNSLTSHTSISEEILNIESRWPRIKTFTTEVFAGWEKTGGAIYRNLSIRSRE